MKILFLTPYPIDSAPSQRFRFEQFFGLLEEKGWKWTLKSYVSQKEWNELYKAGNWIIGWNFMKAYFRRKFQVLRAWNYDIIFIHREASPVGPPFFEWFLAKIYQKKIIYDFDDAIWKNDGHDGSLSWWLKSRWKIKLICKWSWKVTVGNEYLAEYARQWNDDVVVVETVVDSGRFFTPPFIPPPGGNTKEYEIASSSAHGRISRNDGEGGISVGWTGSHSTLFYLDMVMPVIRKLQEELDFEFVVIANRDPALDLRHYRLIPWNKETEVEDLAKIDIGIMPLEDNEWAIGKCGFKLIQYGALGIPSVASPVGVNGEIISHGENGFLASSEAEWEEYLKTLIKDAALRKEMGIKARGVIVDRYSVEAVKEKFLGLFERR